MGTWFKVDPKLHDHRKARRAGKSAIGVWVLAGSWSMDRETDGFIPRDLLARWGTPTDAKRLVEAGLWDVAERDGEQGWQFHDWTTFQPPASTLAAWRAKESDAGTLGNHKRWHEKRGITDPNCEHCYRVPDQVPDQGPDGYPESGGESGPESGSDRTYTRTNTIVTSNEVTRVGDRSTPPIAAVPDVVRDDVERLCDRLADRIATNGSKRPAITKGWRDAARLMIDRDGRNEDEIARAIDWCQADEFWRANVLSMPKLREKFDQMRLQAERRQQATGTRRQQGEAAMFDRMLERAQQREAGER